MNRGEPVRKRGSGKGVLFSARLHPDYPGEDTAIEILSRWEADGHERRYILAAALNALDHIRVPPPPATAHGATRTKADAALLLRLAEIMQAIVEARVAGATQAQIERHEQEFNEISEQLRRSLYNDLDVG